MKLTRINVCTLVLAVVLAVFTTPVYKDLVAQIPGTVSSMSRWLLPAFAFAAAGASALYGARLISRWIFAHAARRLTAEEIAAGIQLQEAYLR